MHPVAEAPARILLVDDEPEIAESLSDFLVRKERYDVSLAATGEEAIAIMEKLLAEQIELDLVLLDMRMPGISGLEVLNWIRDHPVLRYTRVVLVTAAAGSEEKVEALSAGADDYITKPFYPKELLARVKTILRTQQLEKQLQRQSQQLSFLNHIGQELATVLETQDVLTTAVTGAQQVFELDSVSAYMLEGGRLRCRAVAGGNGRYTPQTYTAIIPNQGFLGQVFVKQKAALLNDAWTDTRYDQRIDAPPSTTVSTLLAAPIVVRSHSVGIIAGYNKKNGRFTETDLELFASLAISVGEAIQNAWMFQRIRLRQKELLESRNTLQALIDGIPHPIYTINNQWQLVAINRSKIDQQPTPTEHTGQVCYKAFYQRETPCPHCQVAASLTHKEAQGWSVKWQGEDHLLREWEVNAYPVPGSKADSASAVILWQDRTDERQMESSLLQAGKLAAIGQLAAGVAHEINNPLTAINANAEMLKMFIPPEDENYEAVELIALAGERATKVVRGLLDFARQEQYRFTPNQINKSIKQALDLVSYQLQTANIKVIQNFATDLPELTASWEHLKSVWLNLLVNARDAVENRSENRQIEITTCLVVENYCIQVLIRDNGKGMSAAEAEHIFEPFYTTKDPGKGTGLGLATSHRIIEQHDGDINVVSIPNEGTTFIIRLPVIQEDLTNTTQES
ncbi:MAG: response regulator [Anaerolineae bacterium]|nr:response regulator [Anaerolineae bacterium]